MVGASSISDHGEYVFKTYIPNIPFVEDAAFIPALQKVCDDYKIDFIFPAHDSVVQMKYAVLKKKHIKNFKVLYQHQNYFKKII